MVCCSQLSSTEVLAMLLFNAENIMKSEGKVRSHLGFHQNPLQSCLLSVYACACA